MIIDADKNNFEKYMDKKCVVDFFASGCPSCEKFSSVFEELSNENNDYIFLKVNLDDDLALAEKFGISHIPTIIKFSNGNVEDTKVGYMNKDEIKEFIKA